MKLFLEIEPGIGHSAQSEPGADEAEHEGPGSLALEMGSALGCWPQTEAFPDCCRLSLNPSHRPTLGP